MKAGFNVSLANYSAYNAETFDPYNITKKGNHGIDSIRNLTEQTLQKYHDKAIAASQVDIVGHSMGGLLSRGFIQQPDYKNINNFKQGYIHRLITIGTPHFGGHLAGFLITNQNNEYCSDSSGHLLLKTLCNPTQLKKLNDIFAQLGLSITKGGVDALIPGSSAYSKMCQTNISSYAIAASWAPNAKNSYNDIQYMYRNITGNPNFDIDINGFNGTTHGNNDLQANITSQLGGLPIQFRIPDSTTLPNQSEVYNNTVHYFNLLDKNDTHATWELNSTKIQNDVIHIFQSPQDKFAPAIGIGSPCEVPQ